jgi:hypothetical protein
VTDAPVLAPALITAATPAHTGEAFTTVGAVGSVGFVATLSTQVLVDCFHAILQVLSFAQRVML